MSDDAAAAGPAGPVLAVDVGGTKLAVAVVDATGRPSRIQRGPTAQGPRADAEVVWAALAALITSLLVESGLSESDLAGVGVGCGGPMVWPAGEVSPLNCPGGAASRCVPGWWIGSARSRYASTTTPSR